LPEIKRYHNLKSLADIKKIYRKSNLRQKVSSKDEQRLEEFYDLLKRIFVIDADQRILVEEAMSHPFFNKVGNAKEKKAEKSKEGQLSTQDILHPENSDGNSFNL
jgi:serine/threonine protein kinase